MPGLSGLYVITGEDFSRSRSYREVVSACIRGGAWIIQLREKGWNADRLVETGREIRKLTAKAGVLFIVNDRVDVALAVQADGVHIGQQDIPLHLVRRMVDPGFIVGVSAGTPQEAVAAENDGATYIGVGPVFPTDTKKDARTPRGLELLGEIKRATTLPVFGIGGIKINNVASVIRAGADGAAVISAVVGADDIAGAARAFVQEIKKVEEHI